MPCPPPPPPLNKIDNLIHHGNFSMLMVVAATTLLVVLILWHVGQAFSKRLWLLPSHPSQLLALNASSLALLSIVAKPAKPGDDKDLDSNEFYMLIYTVLICAVVGALMPSVAASTDLRGMWMNVIGVGVLVISVNFIIFLQLFYGPQSSSAPNIHHTAMEHKLVMAFMFLLLLVLLLQAAALEAMMSDVKANVLEQLDQLSMEAKPGYKDNVRVDRPWSWAVVEHNTHIKLMMVVTSNPQHVMARSPSAAIVGALVLSCAMLLVKVSHRSPFKIGVPHQYHRNLVSHLLHFNYAVFISLCAFICMWRWARVALQEDRPFLSLLSAAEPTYWCRKVIDFQRMLKRPNVRQHHGFKEVVKHTTSFLLLCFVIPFHRLLVAMTRFTHNLSALLMQKLIWPPLKALSSNIFTLGKWLLGKGREVVDTAAEPVQDFDSQLGVVCLEGEDARIVRQEFVGAVDVIIQKQLKRAKTNPHLKDLISFLQRSKNTLSSSLGGKSTCILDILLEDSAAYVENLHVEHGYQYGWGLTVVSLLAIMTEIEVVSLGTSEMSDAAMYAYSQAMEMIQVVDEQFVPCIVCSKETYACATASEWSKLRKKKKRWLERRKLQAKPEVKLHVVDQVLDAILDPLEKHLADFNKKNIAAAWPLQTVVSYTMHTVCQSLSRWWSDLENARVAIEGGGGGGGNASEMMIKGMVEYINVLIAEVVACCLSNNLPTALDMSMTEAVLSGSVRKIEKGLLLVGQGKCLWETLQWSTLRSPTTKCLGQLGQWIHLADNRPS